jgi:UDP-3-O-[3-hydroxymyristoyl] glucosamine N-acyltransferase
VEVRLGEIVARFGGEIVGAGDTAISRIATLENAGAGDLAFLANPKYRHQLATTRAAAVIMAPPAVEGVAAAILTAQPYLYYARVAQWLNPPPAPEPGIHPTAVVEGEVAASASIGPNVWIDSGATIGPGVVIAANCSIGAGVSIGADSRLASNVAIYPGSYLGARCLVHSGAVIGADGFGFAREDDGRWVKIPQVGRVLIGDDCRDRRQHHDRSWRAGRHRASKPTVSSLDNQIQIGHNVHIGAHTAIAGCAAIAGSTRVGRHCLIAGGAGIIGHLEIADRVTVGAMSLVTHHLREPGEYVSGTPIQPKREWRRNAARFGQLDQLARRVRKLLGEGTDE